MKNKKELKDLYVTKMDKKFFACNEPVYRFNTEGIPLLELPLGSLIFTGQAAKGIAGFGSVACGVWRGKNEITEIRRILIRKFE